ncbi:hypothetical protein PanWU01x14_037070 [Parasponia andersonii]|uniref:Glycine rich protein n=1 Tax=Parasponia andersonii TaxID=3476 RepID=A0A2P5DSP1_PARAD|nr:hypothetical protein PanWU01x14_037070 [Parasponia andersonii]
MAVSVATKFMVMSIYVSALLLILLEFATAFHDVAAEKLGRKILQEGHNTNGRSGYNGYTTTGRGGYN